LKPEPEQVWQSGWQERQVEVEVEENVEAGQEVTQVPLEASLEAEQLRQNVLLPIQLVQEESHATSDVSVD